MNDGESAVGHGKTLNCHLENDEAAERIVEVDEEVSKWLDETKISSASGHRGGTRRSTSLEISDTTKQLMEAPMGPGKVDGVGPDDRVIATAQQIVKSLNTTQNVREDMLLILSSFDNRLSNITDLVQANESSFKTRLEEAEKILFMYESGVDFEIDEVSEYFSALDDVLNLLEETDIKLHTEIVDRAETIIQMAMSRLEDEFRSLLVRSFVPMDANQLCASVRKLAVSSESAEDSTEEEEEEGDDDDDDGGGRMDWVESDDVAQMENIANRMIRAGYEKECVQVYMNVRRDVLDKHFAVLGMEKLSIEEVQRIEWKNLDEKMKKWTQAVHVGVRVVFRREKRLCDLIFNASGSAKEICFNETVRGCLMQLLNFGEAIAIGRRSSERLFRILDMHDALHDVFLDLQGMVTDGFLCGEVKGVLDGLKEAVKGTFTEFENAVKNESSKPVVRGDIHPLTKYVMNYVELAVDYSSTLNSLLESDGENPNLLDGTALISRRFLNLLSILESNLENKSKLCDGAGLEYIFLVNNILYMVKKVKDSGLIRILGEQWVCKHRTQIRARVNLYLRKVWLGPLRHLRDPRLEKSSNDPPNCKCAFRDFNLCFEEILRVQSLWKVPDPQFREELRLSVAAQLLPAYRSFFVMCTAHSNSKKNHEKYRKYTPDELETLVGHLFEGVPLNTYNRRKGLHQISASHNS